MKQKDVALILVIAFISAVLSFFVSHLLFASKGNRNLTAETIDTISSSFEQPDSKYFNNTTVDPTQLIRIGNNQTNQPFNAATQ